MGSTSVMMAPGLIDNTNAAPGNSLKRRRDSIVDLTIDDDESPQPKRPRYVVPPPQQRMCGDSTSSDSDIACACGMTWPEIGDSIFYDVLPPRSQMCRAQAKVHFPDADDIAQPVAPTRPTVALQPMPVAPRPQMRQQGLHQYGFGNTVAQSVAPTRPTVYGINAAQLVAPTRPAVSFAPVPIAGPAPTAPTAPATSQPSKEKKQSKRDQETSGAEKRAPPLTLEQQRDVTAKSQSFMEMQTAELDKASAELKKAMAEKDKAMVETARGVYSVIRQAKKKADGLKRRAEERELREARREEIMFQQQSLKAVKDQERREKDRAKAARLQAKQEKAAAKAARLQARQSKAAAKISQPSSTLTPPASVVNEFSADATFCNMAGQLTIASDGSWLKWVPMLEMHSQKAVDLQREDVDPVFNVSASKEGTRKHRMKVTTKGEEEYIFQFGTDTLARQDLVEAVETIKRKPWRTEQTIEQTPPEALRNAVTEEVQSSSISDTSEQDSEDMVLCTCHLPAEDCRCDEREEEEESSDGGFLILETNMD